MQIAHQRSRPEVQSTTVQVIVETPRGSRNKYKLDEESGRMKLSKVMPEGMVFPYDFGFFPGTRAQDGDPLDVLILSDEATFPGCQIDCRLVGVLQAQQGDEEGTEKRNDRIIAIAEASVLYSEVADLAALSPKILTQIEEFFVNYQKVRGIKVTVLGRGDRNAATSLVETARMNEAR
jgi:inorganic pyrophosphatase